MVELSHLNHHTPRNLQRNWALKTIQKKNDTKHHHKFKMVKKEERERETCNNRSIHISQYKNLTKP